MRLVKLALLLSISSTLLACGGSGSEEPTAGPPLVKVVSAVDANSAADVVDIALSDILVNGVSPDLHTLSAKSSNIQLVGTTLQCKVPCSFSTLEGSYVMAVRAPGYEPAPVSFEAKYSSYSEGCPATYSGSKDVSVSLSPL